jgi:hypothetical protein
MSAEPHFARGPYGGRWGDGATRGDAAQVERRCGWVKPGVTAADAAVAACGPAAPPPRLVGEPSLGGLDRCLANGRRGSAVGDDSRFLVAARNARQEQQHHQVRTTEPDAQRKTLSPARSTPRSRRNARNRMRHSRRSTGREPHLQHVQRQGEEVVPLGKISAARADKRLAPPGEGAGPVLRHRLCGEQRRRPGRRQSLRVPEGPAARREDGTRPSSLKGSPRHPHYQQAGG